MKTKGKTGGNWENEAKLEEEFPLQTVIFRSRRVAALCQYRANVLLIALDPLHLRSDRCGGGLPYAFSVPNLQITDNAESRTYRLNTVMLLGLEQTPSVRKKKNRRKNSIKKLIGKKKNLFQIL